MKYWGEKLLETVENNYSSKPCEMRRWGSAPMEKRKPGKVGRCFLK